MTERHYAHLVPNCVADLIRASSRDEAAQPGAAVCSRQLVSTGVLCRKVSSSICLTRKSATSAREMNPHVQRRGAATARNGFGVRPPAQTNGRHDTPAGVLVPVG